MRDDGLLSELEALGVRLSLQTRPDAPDELRVQAPKGALTPALQARLRVAKPALLDYLSRQRRPVDLSLFFFGSESASGPGEKYRLLLEAAAIADQAGFAGIWTPERHFHDLGGLFPNPAVIGAALAVRTTRLKIRAGSVVLPLQDPIRVAEEWSVVDNLSDGRVELSFASGWHANDFALAPGEYFRRHELLYERLGQVCALWRGEGLARRSGDETITVCSFPRPIQPELPFWLTAIGNPASYQRIGGLGADLLTALLDQSIAELAAKLPLYHQARAEAGHPPGKVAVFMHTYVGAPGEDVRERVRVPFKAYLGQTLSLLGQLSRSLGLAFDPEAFGAEETDALMEYAFARYYEERALMGDPAACAARLTELARAGVDEVACLVDFGLDSETVLAGIRRLAHLLPAQSMSASRPLSAGLETAADV